MRSHPRVPVVALVVAFLFLPLGAAPGLAQGAAPGAPIFDCADAAARHARMARGLGVQDEAIRRTDAQIAALKEARAAGTKEARDQLVARSVDTVKSHADDELEALTKLTEKALSLPAGSALAGARGTWLRKALNLQEEISNLKKLAQAFQAGEVYGTQVQSQSHTVIEHLKQANELFVESGLAEEIGGSLAKAGGPLGVAAFEASLFVLDYAVADLDSSFRQAEQQDLENALWTMRHAYGEVNLKMADLVNNCPAQFGKATQPPPTVSTSLTPPLPEPPAPQTPEASASKKSGGNAGKAAVVVLGGAALAGAAVYAGQAMSELATTTASGECYSSRNCIVSVMSSGCSCGGSLNAGCDWTGGVGGTNAACGGGMPCRAGLSCNNGRCEGSSGRCPF